MSQGADLALDGITAQAVEWFTTLRSGSVSTADREAFARWMAESPVHVREYLGVADIWGAYQAMKSWPGQSTADLAAAARAVPPAAVLPIAKTQFSGGGARAPRKRLLSIAASLAACLAVILCGFAARDWFSARSFSTKRGEQRSIVLSDGSVVQLNTLTRIVVHYDERERRIELSRGEAFFRVSPQPSRPFEVVTAVGVVRAVGTEFNVYSSADGIRVAVVEGKVQVAIADPSGAGAGVSIVPVEARQSVEIRAGHSRVEPLPAGEAEHATAWMQRRLTFENKRLEEVVEEFNRYNRRQMRIEGEALASLQINGVFNADYPEALVKYLERMQAVEVSSRGEELLITRRPKN